MEILSKINNVDKQTNNLIYQMKSEIQSKLDLNQPLSEYHLNILEDEKQGNVLSTIFAAFCVIYRILRFSN